MKWRRVRSRDVVDIRGASGRRGGGRMGMPGGIAGLGGGAGLIVVLVVLGIQLLGGGGAAGFDVGQVLAPGTAAPGAGNPQPIPPAQDPQRDLKDFSTYVFEDAQGLWSTAITSEGRPYDRAQLVLYSGAVSTEGCGGATSAVGPFYCPADGRVYLDLSFFEDMRRELGASGDFAWAYVIAHEMGHHVQSVVGTSEEVRRAQGESPEDANELSVRLELQADCYAGFWASTVFEAGDLERGDLKEAFRASEAVGDDRLQSRAGGSVNPDSFTHGTSEQRRSWFTRGYRSSDAGECDTFAVEEV
jgi:predicted metalloprotease